MRSRSTARPSRAKTAVQASDTAAMPASTWWWKAPAAANWVGPYDGKNSSMGLFASGLSTGFSRNVSSMEIMMMRKKPSRSPRTSTPISRPSAA